MKTKVHLLVYCDFDSYSILFVHRVTALILVQPVATLTLPTLRRMMITRSHRVKTVSASIQP